MCSYLCTCLRTASLTDCVAYNLCGDFPMIKQEIGITHVVNVTPDMCKFPNCMYHHVPIVDKSNVNIKDHFESTYNFIDAAISTGGRVYVHCIAGVSRSTTMVLYYLMKKRAMTLEDAYIHVWNVIL